MCANPPLPTSFNPSHIQKFLDFDLLWGTGNTASPHFFYPRYKNNLVFIWWFHLFFVSLHYEIKNNKDMEREEILKELKSIIGRSFQFSDAFIKKCPVYIGVGERPYCRLTQKYLYVSCFKIFSYREDVDEYGVEIKKFPICYNSLYGEFVDKVPLDKLFTSDLKKILDDIKYALWWETNVRLPKIQSELEDAKKYEALFKKLE